MLRASGPWAQTETQSPAPANRPTREEIDKADAIRIGRVLASEARLFYRERYEAVAAQEREVEALEREARWHESLWAQATAAQARLPQLEAVARDQRQESERQAAAMAAAQQSALEQQRLAEQQRAAEEAQASRVIAAPSGEKTVEVRGYYRRDGTYVRPHSRRATRR